MRVVRGSGAVAAAGAAVAIASPAVAPTLAGRALSGLGLAPLAPTVLGAAPATGERLPPPVAIAAVTTVGYLGSFTGPPAICALAGAAGIDPALGLLVVAALAAAALAGRALRGTSGARGPSPPRR